jgi:hypothetical protein
MMPLLAANDADIAIVAIPIAAGLIVAITAIVTHHLRKSQRDDMEATLKMEMIQRGMSAEDVERVLSAQMGTPASQQKARFYAQGGERHGGHARA